MHSDKLTNQFWLKMVYFVTGEEKLTFLTTGKRHFSQQRRETSIL